MKDLKRISKMTARIAGALLVGVLGLPAAAILMLAQVTNSLSNLILEKGEVE